ncbi:Secreted lipase [Trichinella pseudospiralis]
MGVALLSGCLYRSRSCLKSSSITCPPRVDCRDPAIEQRSATFAGTDKSPSESSSAVLTRDLLSASVSVFSSPGQMIRVVSHPEELFHADLFIPKLRYSSANMSTI